MQVILDGIMAFTDWLWGLPMLIVIVGGGFWMSVRLGFPQFTRLGFILKNTIGKSFGEKGEEGKFSGWQAVTGALASTLGAGNIVGTAMAIAFGGPGGVFWLWLSGLFCCAVKFSEVTMGMKYRKLDEKGRWEGGPQIYLSEGTGWKWISPLYAVIVLILNIQNVPAAFLSIFRYAFTGHAAVGGFAGAAVNMSIRWGVARGCYSNDSGTGVTTIVHAVADVNHPIQQSMWAVFEVFFDTIIICTMTGLIIVITGAWDPSLGLEGVNITMEAFRRGFSILPIGSGFAPYFLTISLAFFAFTTILGWAYYSEKCLQYLIGKSRKKKLTYRWIYVLAVFIGPYLTVSAVWTSADIFIGLMAFPNLVALILLSGVVARETKIFLGKFQNAKD